MSENLGDDLCLTETKNQGWWLWSEVVGMNIAMRAKTREEALIEGLQSLQRSVTRAKESEDKYYDFYTNVMEVVQNKDPERSLDE